ncbi:MAG: Uma2 family endonuclease [Planctomycetota bacterium]
MAVAEPLVPDALTAPPTRPRMTLAEFHALKEAPELDRELIRGELWESPMSKRNRHHARVEARVASLIDQWIEQDPDARGQVFSGEAGVDFEQFQSGVGIDVTYFDKAAMERQPEDDPFLTGPPTLAVEIMSPSDRFDRMWAKIDDYLAAGTPWVWVIDPHFQTVLILRPDQAPALATGEEPLLCEPEMPGFSAPARSIFPR